MAVINNLRYPIWIFAPNMVCVNHSCGGWWRTYNGHENRGVPNCNIPNQLYFCYINVPIFCWLKASFYYYVRCFLGELCHSHGHQVLLGLAQKWGTHGTPKKWQYGMVGTLKDCHEYILYHPPVGPTHISLAFITFFPSKDTSCMRDLPWLCLISKRLPASSHMRKSSHPPNIKPSFNSSQICVNPCKSPAKPWIPVMTCWMLGARLGTGRPLCFGGQGPGSPTWHHRSISDMLWRWRDPRFFCGVRSWISFFVVWNLELENQNEYEQFPWKLTGTEAILLLRGKADRCCWVNGWTWHWVNVIVWLLVIDFHTYSTCCSLI